ncbi:hypothetical protein BIT28_06810 [Photobacterium proteolyticum]|uniref:Lyase n=1 Tax=Photobacterium proteolyticum TaxID=1903952 RepID=A0A1Q9GF01_9GAMM|nr:polysaccharide lyase 6 family protein [Photobacterium proteolyticum]OLQ72889.1 hypothetical protein BIT28_06810 [Photobacterium proteolyticum]
MKIKLLPISMLIIFSGLSHASDLQATNKADLFKSLKRAKCGDTIYINDGIYKDVQFKANKVCSSKKQLTLTSKNPGKVSFTGDVNIMLTGDYFTLSGINFVDGNRDYDSDLITVRGKGNRISNNNFDSFDDSKGIWIKLEGTHSLIDHNSFSGKKTKGSYINIDVDSSTPSYHKVSYNYFTRPLLGGNGGSASRVGHGSMHDYNARNIFEFNLFDNENGESEVVSIKSSENIFRNNTFLNSKGHLSLRQGKRNVVIDNYFLGSGAAKENGLFVRGEDHLVFNNYFYNMAPSKKKKDFGTISFGASSSKFDQKRADRGLNPFHFPKTKNVFLVNNTTVQSKSSSIVIGSQYSLKDKKNRSTLPENIYIINNILSNAKSAINIIKENNNNILDNNYISGMKSKQSYKGLQEKDIIFTQKGRLSLPENKESFKSTPLTDYINKMKLFESDWNEYSPLKQRLENVTNAGFSEIKDAQGKPLPPLTKEDVGVNW